MFDPDSELSPHQQRAVPVAERWREKRRQFQQEGRIRARQGNALHQAGCMLFWAEGTKHRNTLSLTNSDVNLLRLFRRFLAESCEVAKDELVFHLHVYTGNDLSIEDIEDYWLIALDLSPASARKHRINVKPASSKGRRTSKLPYGVCTLRVKRSTRLVQQVYGAIQEYGQFEEPSWLD